MSYPFNLTDMKILPVGSSGELLEALWFLKICVKIGLRGILLSGIYSYRLTNEAKSWWQPQIDATYLRKIIETSFA
jgi:hypothetical protein